MKQHFAGARLDSGFVDSSDRDQACHFKDVEQQSNGKSEYVNKPFSVPGHAVCVFYINWYDKTKVFVLHYVKLIFCTIVLVVVLVITGSWYLKELG